jgi:H+-translocating NAD(P) transhydrogenase subunit alpha
MRIAVLSETDPAEPRVAAVPETVKKYKALGAEVAVQAGAGLKAGVPDAEYEAAGASIAADARTAADGADIVLRVRRPGADELPALKRGAIVIAIMDPYGHEAEVKAMAEAGVSAIAMELMPRITRAQVMDVLSSQANLAGYKAVIDAAEQFGRAFPMMMTAAGTVAPAKVMVMGAGVAGLQAIATARRLGAVVSATDVRMVAKEQVESLGATFVYVDDEEARQAETSGGYAKEMSDAYKAKQAALIAETVRKMDVVICTALIPGRPAPRLVTDAMVASMKPGSIVVDLAVEAGGNCEGSVVGQVVQRHGVKIVGYANVPSRLAVDASALYSRNLAEFMKLIVAKDGSLSIDPADEIIKGSLLTRDGQIVHPNFAPAPAAAAQ